MKRNIDYIRELEIENGYEPLDIKHIDTRSKQLEYLEFLQERDTYPLGELIGSGY